MHSYPHDPHNFDDAACGELVEHTEQALVVRVGGLVDLIAAVPYVLTYVPQDAVVVMAFVGDTLRVTACQTLPDPAEVALAGHYLNRVLARVCREPGDGRHPRLPGEAGEKVTHALVVGYGPATIDAILTGIAGRLTVPVRDVVRVHDDRWWCLTCPDPGCCPPGAPVEAPEHVRLALLVAAGAPAANRSDRTRELHPAPRGLRDQVTAALVTCAGGRAAPDPGSRYAVLAAAKERYVDGGNGTGAGVGPQEAAVLLAALEDVRVRDACVLWSDQAVHLWRDLVRLAPPGWVAPAATLLALAAYRRGDSVLANLAIDRALDDDPRYRLAGMVREVLRLGLPPDRLAADLQEMAGEVLSRLAPPHSNPLTADTGDGGNAGNAGDDHGIDGGIDDRRM